MITAWLVEESLGCDFLNPGKFTPGTHSYGGGWKMMFPIELGDFVRFHVDFPGCMVKEHLQ